MPKMFIGAIFFLLVILYFQALDAFVGVTIRTDVSTPPPADTVKILSSLQINHVYLLNADSKMLKGLSGSNIDVIISVTNQEVLSIGQSPSIAASWIKKNVITYYPSTNITAIAVGNNVLSSIPSAASVLVNAMQNLHRALLASDLTKIKVSTPQVMDLIPKPFPPSTATFNSTWSSTIYQILQFLKNTNSYFMLNAYPYYGYISGDGIYPIDYALLRPLSLADRIVDPNTYSYYTNMLDAMVDAAYYSMKSLNFSDIPIILTQTGWPWLAVPRQADATVENAETFNSNLIRRVSSGSGPPLHPAMSLSAYIYELFVEDPTQTSWGIFFKNGSAVFPLISENLGVCPGNSSVRYCVARVDVDSDRLLSGLNWACGQGHADCHAIQDGKPCFYPNTPWQHASFAYNDYYQKMHGIGGTCDFNRTATLSCLNPSNGTCKFAGRLSPNMSFDIPPANEPMPPFGATSTLRVDYNYALLAASLLGVLLR